MSERDYKAALAQANWNNLYPRLVLYAHGRLSRLYFRGFRDGAKPGAPSAADFVHKAIEKTLDGTRVWKMAEVTLFQHLTSVISSDVSHLAESRENRISREADTNDKILHIADYRDDPEHEVGRALDRDKLFAFLESRHPQLRNMAELYLAGARTPDVMVELNMSVELVEKRKKELKKAAEDYRAMTGRDPEPGRAASSSGLEIGK